MWIKKKGILNQVWAGGADVVGMTWCSWCGESGMCGWRSAGGSCWFVFWYCFLKAFRVNICKTS